MSEENTGLPEIQAEEGAEEAAPEAEEAAPAAAEEVEAADAPVSVSVSEPGE